MDKLREQLRKKVADAKAILAKADAETGGIMTADQVTAYDGLMKEVESLKAEIDRRSAMESMDSGLREPVGRGVPPIDIKVGKTRLEDDPKVGFKNCADFAVAVQAAYNHSGNAMDERLRIVAAPSGYMSERGTDEGFSVPPDFRSQVWENVLGDDTSFDLFNVFTGEPTNSTSVNIQKDITNPWDTSGVKAFYVSEASQMQPSSMDQKMDNVPVHKLYAFVLATEELLSDSPRFNDRMTRKVGQAIRYKGSVALAAGNGVGRPLGFTKSGSVVTVAKETGQAAKTIVPQNIANMYSRLFNPQRGIWIISSDAFPQIMLLNLNGMPLWTPYNEGFKYRPNGMLLGQPIYISYHCQTLGTQGDIYFVNADGYMHLQRTTAPEFASSMHLYFDYDTEAFRWTIRHGGQPYMNQAISLPNGQASQSYFVQLATR